MADETTPTTLDVPAEPVNNDGPVAAPAEPVTPPSQIPPAADPNLNSETQKGMPPSSIPNTVDQSLVSHIEAADSRDHQSKNL